MTHGARRLALALVAVLAWTALPSGGIAVTAGGAEPPRVAADAAIAVDAASGAAISAQDAGQRLPIASATKLMTALLTLERARLGETFTAAGYRPDPVESQIGLREGERMAVRDLLVALLLESANDAAITLAEGVEGSTEEFVAAMNERAAELGLDDTSYGNPIGFDAPDNYSTARDLARLTRRLMRRPRFRDIVEEPALRLRSGRVERVVRNRNDLVGVPPGVDGVKTGHTLGAGHVLVGSASRGGNRVISVVLGAPSESARDAATLELLRYGLGQFRERRVVRSGERVGHAAVAHREGERVALSAAEGASLTVLRGERVRTRLEAPEELEGPLPAGRRVGSLAVLHRGEVATRVPVVTSRRVPAPGLLSRVASTLGDWWAAATALVLALGGAVALVAARARRSRTRPEGSSVT